MTDLPAVPPELEVRLRRWKIARTAWSKLAPSHRRKSIRAIEDAKQLETRQRRADEAIAALAKDR
jgi:uncharacterized protein YdeI (YjbR/CyaY-like superfamily)